MHFQVNPDYTKGYYLPCLHHTFIFFIDIAINEEDRSNLDNVAQMFGDNCLELTFDHACHILNEGFDVELIMIDLYDNESLPLSLINRLKEIGNDKFICFYECDKIENKDLLI